MLPPSSQPQSLSVKSRMSPQPFFLVLFGREVDHVVGACVDQIIIPFCDWDAQEYQRVLRPARDPLPMVQLQPDWFCAVVTEGGNVSIMVKHDMKGDGVPGTIRKIPLSINSVDERSRYGRERVGHQNPLRSRNEENVMRRFHLLEQAPDGLVQIRVRRNNGLS